MSTPESRVRDSAPRPAGVAPRREVLGNGVTVLAKETRTTPAVTLHLNLDAGTVHDPASAVGLAHFVSRTIDRGSQRHTADEVAEELDARGVTLTTTVGRHTLSLVCTCLAEDLSSVLGLLGELIMQPSFPQHEVDRRRREIITLIRQDEDNPAVVAVENLLTMLYTAGHPYGRRVRGTVASAQSIERSHLLQFHAARCVPPGLCVACVGDVEPARVVDAVQAIFGDWRAQGEPSPTVGESPSPAGRQTRVVPMMNKSQTDIAYGFKTISRSDPSYHACWLMNTILGQYSLGGRLGDSIREQQGMAYYVFSALEANVRPGPLVIRAGVSASNVPKAVASIDAELAKLAQDGPTDDELTESKQYLIGSMPRTLETNMGIAAYLQTVELFDLGLDYDLRLPDLLSAITRDEVHQAARGLIDPARATVVVAGPYEGTL